VCGALSTFLSSDLDVAQEYPPPFTQQLEEGNEATSGRPLFFCYMYASQGTMLYITAGIGVKN
jgi:hypothetical protein